MTSLIDNSEITCDEILDTTGTASINYFIFHTILLVTICLLMLVIIAINCYYVKHGLKLKKDMLLLYY